MTMAAERPRPRDGDVLLDRLGEGGGEPIDCSRVMAVFAHPDDETIAMGGQLRRLSQIRLLHVTDGAPANMADATANGFPHRAAYAAARRAELVGAVGQAGVSPDALMTLGAVDQGTARGMPILAGMLCAALRANATAVVMTHAFEGGHPDHDATAFIVHSACAMLEREGAVPPDVLECPLYHARGGKWVFQEFARLPEAGTREHVVDLHGEAAEAKRRMLSAFVTQRRTLTPFSALAPERFRRAPRYDFAQLPNGGDLLYEWFDWGLDRHAWLRLAGEARHELGLPRWF